MNKRSIEPLNLGDALRLYGMIAPYIEDPDERTLTAEFVQNMLVRMVEKDASVYTRCIELMSGKLEAELFHMNSVDVLSLFMECLRANQIVALYRFGKGLRYA